MGFFDDNTDAEDDAKIQQLTDRERSWRDKFVKEYLVDYDQYAACLRLGYAPNYAKEWCIKLMDDPYVRQQISKKEASPEELDAETEKKRIRASLWKEANFRGAGSSQAARVAALAKLSAFMGMDAPTRSQAEISGKDGAPLGGFFVVPGIMTPEEWAKEASRQQAELTNAGPAEGQVTH